MLDDAQKIEFACMKACTSFYRALDENRDEDVLARFAEDGVWHRNQPARGLGEIAAALQKRSTTRRIRHVLTNVLVERIAAQGTLTSGAPAAHLSAYLAAYEADTGVAVEGPMSMPAPKLLGRIDMVMAESGGEWKIRELRTLLDFVKPPAQAVPTSGISAAAR
jgi:hypothetical protein